MANKFSILGITIEITRYKNEKRQYPKKGETGNIKWYKPWDTPTNYKVYPLDNCATRYNELLQWCKTNAKHSWNINENALIDGCEIIFYSKKDAVMFKLIFNSEVYQFFNNRWICIKNF